MSSVSRAEVRRIARLARIRVGDEEADALGRDLAATLEYVKLLDEVDVSGVAETSTVMPLATPFRVDEVAAAMEPESVVMNAPAHEGSAFAVPKVLGAEAEG
ncbi:MAG: Asp-tRNA(Asn)/Glu-tRNA(Gln) amidotransferase subunit GatC [Deltaproteobacteria bacterium]|nr:Asp-tRNA(Asn)/Glu-tRNA(Gln) amidotransferase subunit GatC [Deltaproteobacteria bacterium]